LKGQSTYFQLPNPQGSIFIEVEDLVETGNDQCSQIMPKIRLDPVVIDQKFMSEQVA